MSSIAIGDIHGNAHGLQEVLSQLRAVVTSADTVVFLGDYIDRGPGSKACIDQILAFTEAVAAPVVCLSGNHEEWLLRSCNDYTHHAWLIGMDGFTTIRSYSSEAESTLRTAARAAGEHLYTGRVALPYEAFFDRMPSSHLTFFRTLRPYFQNDDAVFVHAGVDDRVPLDEQGVESLMFGWDDRGFPDGYEANDVVVYGHRNNAVVDASGWPHPRIVGRTIGLDSSRHGVVTALRLPDHAVFQSSRCP